MDHRKRISQEGSTTIPGEGVGTSVPKWKQPDRQYTVEGFDMV